MIIECTSCHARYQYDENRFERKASKKIKCAKCGSVFEIHNPALAPPAPLPAEIGESTGMRREETSIRKLSELMAEPEAEAERETAPPAPDQPQLPAGKRLSLAIIDGPDAGSVHRMEKPRVTIGRSNADITLNDSEASRQHAAVTVRDALVQLEDLKSTNGTLYEGNRIEGKVELHDKAEFQVGATTLMLIVTDDA